MFFRRCPLENSESRFRFCLIKPGVRSKTIIHCVAGHRVSGERVSLVNGVTVRLCAYASTTTQSRNVVHLITSDSPVRKIYKILNRCSRGASFFFKRKRFRGSCYSLDTENIVSFSTQREIVKVS